MIANPSKLNKFCNLASSGFSQNKPDDACRKSDWKGKAAPKAGSCLCGERIVHPF